MNHDPLSDELIKLPGKSCEIRQFEVFQHTNCQGEIRLDDDGLLDEIVGNGFFHLERLNETEWFLDLGGVKMYLSLPEKTPFPMLFL